MGRTLRKNFQYSSRQKILLVGEGDFSFALSLAKKIGAAANLTATSLNTREQLRSKYRQAKANVEELEGLGCRVIHGVDAKTMDQHPLLRNQEFDRIVFNFPHTDFRKLTCETDLNTILRHQALVKGFMRSAKKMVRSSGEIHITHKTEEPFSEWDIGLLGRIEGLSLIAEVPFCRDDYPGYNNKRGSGVNCDSAFLIGEASTFKFTTFTF